MAPPLPRVLALLLALGLLSAGAYLLRGGPQGAPDGGFPGELRRLATAAAGEPLVLAVLYPWYGRPGGPAGRWSHWGDFNHTPDTVVGGRRDIAAADYPLGGPYDSLDPSVLRRHFDLARRRGIDAFLVSWWGPRSPEDRAFRVLLNFSHAYGPSPRLAIFMESLGIQGAGGPPAVRSALLYALERYGADPAVLHVAGVPVVYLYTTYRVEAAVWRAALGEAWARGLRFLPLGDALFYDQARWLAGVGVYNAAEFHHKGFDLPSYYEEGRAFATRLGALFYGTATPGYDDRPTHRPTAFVVPRDGGRFYNLTWEAALAAGARWMLITSFNEWHEATEIEASVEDGGYYENLTGAWVGTFRGRGPPPGDPAPRVSPPPSDPQAWPTAAAARSSHAGDPSAKGYKPHRLSEGQRKGTSMARKKVIIMGAAGRDWGVVPSPPWIPQLQYLLPGQ